MNEILCSTGALLGRPNGRDYRQLDRMAERLTCDGFEFMIYGSWYPEIHFIYDTKMAQFHRQTLQIFEPEWDWILREGHIRHLHINDYDGGYMDWGNFHVLPIGQGDVDFAAFFAKLFSYGYEGDYTIEATAFDDVSGAVDFEMLNRCVGDLRKLIRSK